MADTQAHTQDLVVRLMDDCVHSSNTRRVQFFGVLGFGLALLGCSFLLKDLPPNLDAILTYAGASIGGVSLFPINDIMKLNAKITTLRTLRGAMESGPTSEEVTHIHDIVWNMVAATVA